MDKFKDKVAIVTGGASGIGQAICEELGRLGAFVVVTDINEVGALKAASAINEAGGQSEAMGLDVTDPKQVKRVITETADKHGRLDYMFNNAGIAIIGDARDMKDEQWRQIVDINLMGVIYGTSAAYALMVDQGFGHIVNIASHSGIVRYPIVASYSTTKHGVVGLSTSLRVEGADLGVKITVVCPGPVETSLWDVTTVLGARTQNIFSKLPMISAEKAAKIIMRGVSRNRAIIVFPFKERVTWWLYRLHPAILEPAGRLYVKGFRKYVRKS